MSFRAIWRRTRANLARLMPFEVPVIAAGFHMITCSHFRSFYLVLRMKSCVSLSPLFVSRIRHGCARSLSQRDES